MTFIPNSEQSDCILHLNQFITENKAFSRLLINGSAGTGKTTILISSIIGYLNGEIRKHYAYYKDAIDNNKWEVLDILENFIISAPTNKAKDVLVSKYNTYLIELKKNNTHIIDSILLEKILHYKINFLTVSQVLSISRVINEMGDEEFTKGNEKKISDKYSKPAYNKTIIIIDECSMIDTNTSKILGVIKCPIIYLGDYCQLPPVNENLSPIFNMVVDCNSSIIKLNKVERCTKNITEIATVLRDKIYDIIPDFNLLKYKVSDVVIYQKQLEKWLDTYVEEIKGKLLDIKKLESNTIATPEINIISGSSNVDNISSNASNNDIDESNRGNGNDSMILAWTNKCCGMLNQKVRNKLFIHTLMNYDAENQPDEDLENIDDIHDHFLIRGDKLLVKSPYYKYGFNIYSSSIVYISKVKKVKYTPLSFKEWCNLANTINNAIDGNKNIIFDINLADVLEDNKPKKTTPQKNILDYFKTPNSEINDNQSVIGDNISREAMERESVKKAHAEICELRLLFYQYHTLGDILIAGTYIFNLDKDKVAIKYNAICEPEFNLMTIKESPSIEERERQYIKWHRKVTEILFGIPVDKVLCKKCAFFIKKLGAVMNKSCNVADMINETESLTLNMYLTDLAVFTTSSKYINHGVPILDILDKSNLDNIARIRDIMKSSYEVKIPLSKIEEKELKTINKILGEDESGVQKYITMSQMFGHYLNHVITSTYLEVDYGYALTVHKSQGSTYDDVFIEYNNLIANKKDSEKYKLLYTAITRSANKLHIYH